MLLKIQLLSQISQRNVVLSQRALAAAEQRLAIDVDWQRGKISTHQIDASLAMSDGELCRRRVDCARRLVARAHTNVRVAQVAVGKRRETPAAEARFFVSAAFCTHIGHAIDMQSFKSTPNGTLHCGQRKCNNCSTMCLRCFSTTLARSEFSTAT